MKRKRRKEEDELERVDDDRLRPAEDAAGTTEGWR
jgi:hypothetical protein